MARKRLTLTVSLVGIAAIAGIAIGVYLGTQGFGTATPAQAAPATVSAQGGVPLQTNADGLTFGTPPEGTALEDLPDLLPVFGDNGTQGFAYTSDIYLPLPSSPTEALAADAGRASNRVIPVYESDGKTQIDTFTIGGGASVAGD